VASRKLIHKEVKHPEEALEVPEVQQEEVEEWVATTTVTWAEVLVEWALLVWVLV